MRAFKNVTVQEIKEKRDVVIINIDLIEDEWQLFTTKVVLINDYSKP